MLISYTLFIMSVIVVIIWYFFVRVKKQDKEKNSEDFIDIRVMALTVSNTKLAMSIKDFYYMVNTSTDDDPVETIEIITEASKIRNRISLDISSCKALREISASNSVLGQSITKIERTITSLRDEFEIFCSIKKI